MKHKGVAANVAINDAVIDAYAEVGNVAGVEHAQARMKQKSFTANVVSCNAVIDARAKKRVTSRLQSARRRGWRLGLPSSP